MRIPGMVWDRRHNVASLRVSYARRIWHTREVDDVILGYNAAGRLARVVLLDPKRILPRRATTADALAVVIHKLLRAGRLRQADLDVLQSALARAQTGAQTGNGPGTGDPSPASPTGPRFPRPRSAAQQRRSEP